MQWVENLWKNHKVWFFLLIPLVLIIFFKDLIFSLLVGSARKVVKETKEKDKPLQTEANKLNNEANKLKTEADSIGDNIENRDGSDVPLDWHRKGN